MKLLQTMVAWACWLGSKTQPLSAFLQKALVVDKWILGVGFWGASWLVELAARFSIPSLSAFGAVLLTVAAGAAWFIWIDRDLIQKALEYREQDNDQIHEWFAELCARAMVFWWAGMLPLFAAVDAVLLIMDRFNQDAGKVYNAIGPGLTLLAFFLRGWAYYVYLSPGVPPAERRLFETRQTATEGA